eukprot:COSAG01_NODE_21605_length_894_cov_0.579874_1_plen_43_part_10
MPCAVGDVDGETGRPGGGAAAGLASFFEQKTAYGIMSGDWSSD